MGKTACERYTNRSRDDMTLCVGLTVKSTTYAIWSFKDWYVLLAARDWRALKFCSATLVGWQPPEGVLSFMEPGALGVILICGLWSLS